MADQNNKEMGTDSEEERPNRNRLEDEETV